MDTDKVIKPKNANAKMKDLCWGLASSMLKEDNKQGTLQYYVFLNSLKQTVEYGMELQDKTMMDHSEAWYEECDMYIDLLDARAGHGSEIQSFAVKYESFDNEKFEQNLRALVCAAMEVQNQETIKTDSISDIYRSPFMFYAKACLAENK